MRWHALLGFTLALAGCKTAEPGDLRNIKVPAGFSIAFYARGVAGARSLALSPSGTVFVGTRGKSVYALVDRDKDGRAEATHVIANDLDTPNGVAFKDGALYVAEVHRVLRYDGIEARLAHPPAPVVVTDKLPKDEHHGWKWIAFGPDGKLYVPVGAPCNLCERPLPYASIQRMSADGSALETYASGVRNTVGFDWDPRNGELWFTENGRDRMGNDTPPDELDHAPRAGMHFGYPYCHGKGIADPEYGSKRPCGEFAPASLELGPHVAALGMRFYTGAMFPTEYQNRVFIAEHGSWNRDEPIGYRITTARVDGTSATDYRVFAEGWLRNGKAWGRPVDVLVMPDGALLVSDDEGNAVYRIVHTGAK
ncbi:PQQ-dependent sugar dehydrogenase [Pendulispora rubella]|uniref:PQQ-dependent sugar dehydrogenase n=1 Tax=Pendulispora rubella TaxID=2741070 RepID=A0ABZ2LGW9_9BACT